MNLDGIFHRSKINDLLVACKSYLPLSPKAAFTAEKIKSVAVWIGLIGFAYLGYRWLSRPVKHCYRGNTRLKDAKKNDSFKIQGTFTATNCKLNSIEAEKQITLNNTTAKSVILYVPIGRKGVITLHNSTIEGNIIVKKLTRNISCNPSNVQSISGIHCNGSVILKQGPNTFMEVSDTDIGNIHIDKLTVNPDGTFTITMKGFSQLDGDFSQLGNMGIQNGATGTVNGKSYQYDDGRFTESTPLSESSKEIQVEINGGGTIIGKVIFEGCKGAIRPA